jgi:hypothetical protein
MTNNATTSQANTTPISTVAKNWREALEWVRTDRARVLATLSLGSLGLSLVLMLLTPNTLGMVSFLVIALALIEVSAGLLALVTWVAESHGRVDDADLWDEADQGDSLNRLLTDFKADDQDLKTDA